MDTRIVQNIQTFLERVQLTGKEVPAFTEILIALNAELQPQPPPAVNPAIPASESNVPKHPAEL